MSNITLTLVVSNSVELLEQYDVIKVYRSSTGEAGEFVEVSDASTRIPLVGSLTSYEYEDSSGDPAYYYKTSYYNSSTEDESDLSAAFKGDLCGNYISVQDLREEGFPVDQMSDARALALIQLWEDFVEQSTGQWFCPRPLQLALDGTGSYLLQLPVPIIRVDSLQINGSNDVLPTSQYVVYNNRYPDDRQNPRIKIKSAAASEAENFYKVVGGDLSGTLYSTLYGICFKRGERNQVVTGLFGYVEANGTAPPLIKYAIRKLVGLNSAKMGVGGPSTIAGPMVAETTDKHKIQYSDKMIPSATLTGDPEVDRILVRYRRPAVIDAPYGELI